MSDDSTKVKGVIASRYHPDEVKGMQWFLDQVLQWKKENPDQAGAYPFDTLSSMQKRLAL